MSRKSVVMKEEEVKLLVEELKKHAGFEKVDMEGSQFAIKLKNLRITFYNPKSSKSGTIRTVFPQGEYQAFDEAYEKVTRKKITIEEMDKFEEDERPVKKYLKSKKYNEFGADEVGKESYGPFIVCAVYYDDEFNQHIFDMQLTDSKAKRIKPKIKGIAEKLIDPKNKLKYVVVAMTDLDSMKHLMPNGVDAIYNYNDIRKSVDNTNNVQAILMNEAIRILVDDYPNVDISESTYDQFVDRELYYNYLKGDANNTSKVHVSKVIDGTEIVDGVIPTKKADTIVNSPSAAASIIASYVRLKFFENANNEFRVVDPDNGEILNMPENNNLEEVIKYGKLFIKKYGIEKFNEVTKKNKKENPFDPTNDEKTKSYYNEIIREVLENNLISDEDKINIRVD